MQKSQWGRLIERIRRNFKTEKEYSREEKITKDMKAVIDTIIFSTSGKRMKLERIVRPRVENVKYHYSRLTQRGTHQEYQYSETEIVEIIKLYQWDQIKNDWREVNLDKL